MRPVTMTITALMAAFTVMPGYTRQDSELDRLDLITVLPRQTELRGFAAKLPPTQRSGGPVRPHYRGAAVGQYKSASCYVTRESDGLLVRVSVAVTTTASAMDELARRSIETPTGDFPTGNPSGARIAPQSWQTTKPGRRTARGTYGLVLRDGRTKVSVRLMRLVSAGSDGQPVWSEITHDDLLMAERLALGCLERLRYLGYGDDQWRKSQSKTRGGKKPKGK
ncbi:MAG: hypothetical protein GX446_17000 [Chthonomonadales bacterium]|nr:hypothetical protein [Chthonomonadales bacterium]